MYYPVQIPYILNKSFSDAVQYSEITDPYFNDFLICFWKIQPKSSEPQTVENIVISDGCIDLVADFNGKKIGFVGMSKTNFEYRINMPSQFFGARMKPGAFYALTGISAAEAMDSFIPLNTYDSDFDSERFFKLPFDNAKEFFKNYFRKLIAGKSADGFVKLFDDLSCDIPKAAEQIYKRLNFSPKQCQRLFDKHFGLTPQKVFCILRFQKCLEILTSERANQNEILNIVNYYDQAHYINDFKRNIGLTPFELVRKYR